MRPFYFAVDAAQKSNSRSGSTNYRDRRMTAIGCGFNRSTLPFHSPSGTMQCDYEQHSSTRSLPKLWDNMSICALCGQPKTLQDSHLIPKWAYRRLQNTEKGRDDPIRVANGTACHTSAQITQHLLCEDCEGRFSRREDYVAKLTTLENGRPNILQYVTRLNTPRGQLAVLSAEIDTAQLAYFAGSILWRSCVMKQGCQLGPYESQFRGYLLEEAPFPFFAMLGLAILEPSSLSDSPHNWVTELASLRAGTLWLHGFMLCGLAFRCFVGQTLKPEMKQVCLAVPSPKKYVSLIPSDQYGDFLGAFDMLTTAKPRGKLATNQQ